MVAAYESMIEKLIIFFRRNKAARDIAFGFCIGWAACMLPFIALLTMYACDPLTSTSDQMWSIVIVAVIGYILIAMAEGYCMAHPEKTQKED